MATKWYKKQMDALLKKTDQPAAHTKGPKFTPAELHGRKMRRAKPGEKRSRNKTDLP